MQTSLRQFPAVFRAFPRFVMDTICCSGYDSGRNANLGVVPAVTSESRWCYSPGQSTTSSREGHSNLSTSCHARCLFESDWCVSESTLRRQFPTRVERDTFRVLLCAGFSHCCQPTSVALSLTLELDCQYRTRQASRIEFAPLCLCCLVSGVPAAEWSKSVGKARGL